MLCFLVLMMTALAQDPYKVAPKNYHLEFENDWVRVSRVTYQPGDKTGVHDHPSLPTVYIYLTDGGEIQFGHQEFAGLRRKAVKAGQIRFNKGNRETHTTQYLGSRPAEYLRIEMKTEPDRPARDVRIAPANRQAFENKMVRIERCRRCGVVSAPSVLVSMKAKSARWVEAKEKAKGGGDHIRVHLLSRPLREAMP